MALIDELAATYWHVSHAARDGVPHHQRLDAAKPNAVARRCDPVEASALERRAIDAAGGWQ